MKAYLDQHGNYYESYGDPLPDSVEVPPRPSAHHGWDGSCWVLNTDKSTAEIEAQRAAAYRAESDPLFFKYQRGEATKGEWLDAVDAIKSRFPKI